MKRNRKHFEKTPIDPERIREVPRSGFSWIDRRFVREGFLEELSRDSILLYFFLLAVADAQGLSFWADPTVRRLLKISAEDLVHARYWLERAGLVLYRDPLYQVLPLPPRPRRTSVPERSAPRRDGETRSIAEILETLERTRANHMRERP